MLLPELGVYLALGGAMFLALALQALGMRAVPLVACAAALAFEMAWRELGLAVAAGRVRRAAGRPGRRTPAVALGAGRPARVLSTGRRLADRN